MLNPSYIAKANEKASIDHYTDKKMISTMKQTLRIKIVQPGMIEAMNN